MVVVRAATSAADLAAAGALFAEYGASLGIDLGFQDFAAELAGLPGAYAPPAGALLLADCGGVPTGCVGVRPLEPPDIAELKRLYVRPAGRGSGAGRALTVAALASARAAGYRRVRLDTLPGMQAAQQLYVQLGFRDIAPYRHNPVAGARYLEYDLGGDATPSGGLP